MTFISLIAQVDKSGNPVFNSVMTNEKEVEKFVLTSNYYTLENNVENKNSSVFISENPTLDEIETASIELPSDFFLLTKESKLVVMIKLENEPKKEFLVIEMKNGKQTTYPAKFDGDITENRANEIIKLGYDSNAKIENEVLTFNGRNFKIIKSDDIQKTVWSLIKDNKLDKKKPSDIYIPSQKELKEYIVSETQKGGEFDFFTEIKGKEYDGVQIKPGIFSTNQSVALYKWGRVCFDIGVNTVEDAYVIYSEIIEKEINKRDKEYIRMGFYKEWEK